MRTGTVILVCTIFCLPSIPGLEQFGEVVGNEPEKQGLKCDFGLGTRSAAFAYRAHPWDDRTAIEQRPSLGMLKSRPHVPPLDCSIASCYSLAQFRQPGTAEFPSGSMGMIVSFFKGTFRPLEGGSLDAVWAETPWGTMLRESTSEHAHKVDSLDVVARDPITTCELPGLDEEGMETLVSNILEGDYLGRTGVRGKEDAVVFLLVNEAIHTLEEIQRKERL